MDADNVVDPVVSIDPPVAAPVGQVVDVESHIVDASTEDQGTDQETDQDPNAAPGTKKPIQPRINELVRQRHDAQREAAYWRGVAEAGGKSKTTQVESPAPAAAPEVPAKPLVKDFFTYDEYVDALTDWKSDRAVEKALAAVTTKDQERTTQQTAVQAEEERSKNWQTRQTATKEVFKDFDEVVGKSDVPIYPHVAELLKDSDHGPAIAYKLAKDPDLAAKLNGMPEKKAIKEFARLEMAFESTTPPSPPPVVPSKAPVPPTPIRVGAATTKDLGKMSMDEYAAARKAAGSNWGVRS
jgi:hypothetical protein